VAGSRDSPSEEGWISISRELHTPEIVKIGPPIAIFGSLLSETFKDRQVGAPT